MLLGVGALAYRNILDLVATQRWVAQTHEVLDTVDATVDVLKDAEIVVRGYLVTGDDELARRRELARPALVSGLDRLRVLLADNPKQSQNLETLDAAGRAKLAYSDDVVDQRRARDLGPGELEGRLSESTRRNDEIQNLAAHVNQEERQLLTTREETLATGTQRTLAAVAGGTTVGVGLLFGVLWLLSREIQQRTATEEQLLVSDRRLTLALDAAQMGLWDLDLATDESTRTLRHDQIFGFETLQPSWGREVVGPLIHPDDREIERAAFERALATDDFKLECRIVRHGDAAVRWISSQGKLFRNARGEPTHLMGSVMDVTERKEGEERLRERSEQLEIANEALGSFTYSVSHDLRAPLRAINGYAHILIDDHADALDAESRRVLDVICANASQMGRLIDDLLSFSRLGRSDLDRTNTDLGALAQSVIDELRRAEPEREVRVEIGALPPADVDPTMMRHVLANLIGNAWKFTRKRRDAAIEIGCENDGGETVFFVRDNGAGFDMQYATKLFRVFERLHRTEDFEGTGVGLAIVHRVVQRHGGRVWAESDVGHGATFYFALPNEKGTHHGSQQRRDSAGRGQSSGRRIGGASAQEA
jgi:PAS domain S-box-containing protein